MKEKDFEMVESIKKLSMNENDILVLRLNSLLPKKFFQKRADNMVEMLKEKIPHIKHVMVLGDDVDLNVITLEDEKPDKNVEYPECEML